MNNRIKEKTIIELEDLFSRLLNLVYKLNMKWHTDAFSDWEKLGFNTSDNTNWTTVEYKMD